MYIIILYVCIVPMKLNGNAREWNVDPILRECIYNVYVDDEGHRTRVKWWLTTKKRDDCLQMDFLYFFMSYWFFMASYQPFGRHILNEKLLFLRVINWEKRWHFLKSLKKKIFHFPSHPFTFKKSVVNSKRLQIWIWIYSELRSLKKWLRTRS